MGNILTQLFTSPFSNMGLSIHPHPSPSYRTKNEQRFILTEKKRLKFGEPLQNTEIKLCNLNKNKLNPGEP